MRRQGWKGLFFGSVRSYRHLLFCLLVSTVGFKPSGDSRRCCAERIKDFRSLPSLRQSRRIHRKASAAHRIMRQQNRNIPFLTILKSLPISESTLPFHVVPVRRDCLTTQSHGPTWLLETTHPCAFLSACLNRRLRKELVQRS